MRENLEDRFIPSFECRLPTCMEVIDAFAQKIESLTGSPPAIEITMCDKWEREKIQKKEVCAWGHSRYDACGMTYNRRGKEFRHLQVFASMLEEYNEARAHEFSGCDDKYITHPRDGFRHLYCRDALRNGKLECDVSVLLEADGTIHDAIVALGLCKQALGYGASSTIRSEQEIRCKHYDSEKSAQCVLNESARWSCEKNIELMRGHLDREVGGFVVESDRFKTVDLYGSRCIPYEVHFDGWPIYEALTEVADKHSLRWECRFFNEGGFAIPGKEILAYFHSHEPFNQNARCFFIPMIGICGIQLENCVVVWRDDATTFQEVRRLDFLKIWGVVYIGNTVEEGLTLLREYIADLRKGRVVREKEESNWLRENRLLPADIKERLAARREMNDLYRDDDDIAEQGLREGGPICNYPD